MTTSKQLKEVALKHFALHGYEGATLALIADEVGIKKPSIYAHFKNKEELFIQTYLDSVKEELNFSKEYVEINKNTVLSESLSNYITEHIKRCEENNNTKFFIRTSYFPPEKFKELIREEANIYVDQLEQIISLLIEKKKQVLKHGIKPGGATSAFLTLLDGLTVELLYGTTKRLKERREESWNVFWQGIEKEKEKGDTKKNE
ncbi:TetR/AcrR family transcriptional regulator [Niallia taxi]|uniref:TetR/AcrR family transcriptional regulator n=1 Tax=Niallia taxi TaxID=2499688 RepID=UPI0020409117|nr:TetR/AcrR family transcriptional regulator [Niallia taxi]MCM3217796.1 TetR/AcrR family transcriptional regulator [Niallia taxi]